MLFNKKTIRLLIFIACLPLSFLVYNCSSGELITGEPPVQIIEVEVPGDVTLGGGSDSNIIIPDCDVETQIIVYDQSTGALECMDKMAEELMAKCSDEPIDNKCAYKFFFTGDDMPAKAKELGCEYWAENRVRTSVGSDFNNDCIDDIAISAPTSKAPNNVFSLIDTVMALFGGAQEPPMGLTKIGGQIHLMLMKDPSEGGSSVYNTNVMSTFKIASDTDNQGSPIRLIGMETMLKDIDGDKAADLVFTANNLNGESTDRLYIFFGSEKYANLPANFQLVKEAGFMLNKDDNGDGRLDMIAVDLGDVMKNLISFTLFDYDGDGKQDLALSALVKKTIDGVEVYTPNVYVYSAHTLISKASFSDINNPFLTLADAEYQFIIGSKNIVFGAAMVGLDIDHDGVDELAIEAIGQDVDGVGILIVDKNTDSEGTDFWGCKKKVGLPENDKCFMPVTAIGKFNQGGPKNYEIISMTADNIDRKPGESASLKDDLVISFQWPDPNGESVFGRVHMVQNVLGGKDLAIYNQQDWKSHSIRIWGNKGDPDVLSRVQANALLGSTQKDRSALGVGLAVMPGGDKPDTILISDPRWDLEGFGKNDWRKPRVYEFKGTTSLAPGQEFYATLNGIAATNDPTAPTQAYIETPDGLNGRIAWYGWSLGVIGNLNKLEKDQQYELFVGIPGAVTLGAGCDIPFFDYMENPTVCQINLGFDFSGSVDVWQNAMQLAPFDQYPDYKILPMKDDYVDLLELFGLSDGIGMDLSQIIQMFMQMIGGQVPPQNVCTGEFVCDDVNAIGDLFIVKEICQNNTDGKCQWDQVAGKCIEPGAEVVSEFECTLFNSAGEDLCSDITNCKWQNVNGLDQCWKSSYIPYSTSMDHTRCSFIIDETVCGSFANCNWSEGLCKDIVEKGLGYKDDPCASTQTELGCTGPGNVDCQWVNNSCVSIVPVLEVGSGFRCKYITSQETCDGFGSWCAWNGSSCENDAGVPLVVLPLYLIDNQGLCDSILGTDWHDNICWAVSEKKCEYISTQAACDFINAESGICEWQNNKCVEIEPELNLAKIDCVNVPEAQCDQIGSNKECVLVPAGQVPGAPGQSFILSLDTEFKLGHFGWTFSN